MGDSASKPLIVRLLPVFVLLIAFAAFFGFGLNDYLTLEQLRENRVWLLEQAEAYGIYALIAFSALYCLIVAVSIPGASVMTITAGFLFGIWQGTAAVVIGATLGAVIIFLAVSFGVGDSLRKKAGPTIQKMEAGFQENAFSYLLLLRLLPLFPFWLVNIVPAIFGVRVTTFAVATLIGIFPGSLVYVSIGNGIGAIFDQGKDPDLSLFGKPEILVPILGLSILSFVPILYKKYKKKKETSA